MHRTCFCKILNEGQARRGGDSTATGEGSVQVSGMVIRKRNVPGHHSLSIPVLATKTLARAVSPGTWAASTDICSICRGVIIGGHKRISIRFVHLHNGALISSGCKLDKLMFLKSLGPNLGTCWPRGYCSPQCSVRVPGTSLAHIKGVCILERKQMPSRAVGIIPGQASWKHPHSCRQKQQEC